MAKPLTAALNGSFIILHTGKSFRMTHSYHYSSALLRVILLTANNFEIPNVTVLYSTPIILG